MPTLFWTTALPARRSENLTVQLGKAFLCKRHFMLMTACVHTFKEQPYIVGGIHESTHSEQTFVIQKQGENSVGKGGKRVQSAPGERQIGRPIEDVPSLQPASAGLGSDGRDHQGSHHRGDLFGVSGLVVRLETVLSSEETEGRRRE